MELEEYNDAGFTIFKNVFANAELNILRAQISEFILQEARIAGPTTFACAQKIRKERLPDDGLILLRDTHPLHMQRTIDRIKCSASLYQLIYSKNIIEIAQRIFGIDNSDHVGLSHPNFRADLPHIFDAEERKFSLPWHQESKYYTTQASALSSVVFWIPLFDCGPEDGCLELLVGSHKQGNVEHKSYFVDETNNQHFRFEVSDEITKRFPLESRPLKAGEVLTNHFQTIHRSGINRSNSVRYTVLIRASNLFCSGYIA